MDRRSWPWKKKSSERILASNESADSSPGHSTRHPDDQDMSKILVDHATVSDEGTTKWQQSEEKVKHLNERLSEALLDAKSKDDLVKQHAKVAEEAISGWEKAEAEAATLRQQLESAIQQKLATEDRVSHLDGALKECMYQLRHVREQQEEKIHDAIVKKTRDWDRTRSELEEKLADLEQSFLEKAAENTAFSKLLQERSKSMSEMSEALSKCETEVNILQIRLESAEKENATLKYELNVAKKELEIRTEERVLSKKAADSLSKQRSEDAKKIAKLEAECQRLRGLVRKKLPGPGALAQMKMEIDMAGKEKGDSNRRKIGKGNGSPRAAPLEPLQDMSHEEFSSAGKEVEHLSERLSAAEEETKILKEALTRKNMELQSARLMCARTASKLSSVEEQLHTSVNSHDVPKAAGIAGLHAHVEAARSLTISCEPSLASISEDEKDGLSCSESWASALIAELHQFKREKSTPKRPAASKMELMDDFIEMEQQLASLPSSTSGNSTLGIGRPCEQNDGTGRKDSVSTVARMSEDGSPLEQSLSKKNAELQEAHRLCEELSGKLAAAEEQVASLQSENASNQSSLLGLQEKLNKTLKAQEEGSNLGDGAPHHSMESIQAHIKRLSKGPFSGDSLSIGSLEGNAFTNHHTVSATAESSSDEEASSFISDADSKLHGVGPELTSVICKVVRLVEDLAVAITGHQQSDTAKDHFDKLTDIVPAVRCKNPELDAKILKLISASNHFLHGKVDLVKFVAELSSVLGHLSKIALSGSNVTPKPVYWGKLHHPGGEREQLSGADSPISDTSNSDGSDEATKIAPAEDLKDTSSQEILRIEDELRKAKSEKVALETHMRAEFRRFSSIEQELAHLKEDKIELEDELRIAKEKLEFVKAQLNASEELVSNLRVQLDSFESSKHLADEQACIMAASRDELEAKLKTNGLELSYLHEKVEALEKELLNERKKTADLDSQCQEFKEQIEKETELTCQRCAAAKEAAERANKELEIAAATEKLAECQRSIMVLGKQLQSLVSPKDSSDAAPDHPVHQHLSPSARFFPSQSQLALYSDDGSEAGSSARFVVNGETSLDRNSGRDRRLKKDLSWDPRDSIASDILDSELATLSRRGHSSGKAMYELFGDKIPVHEDYIEAVAQLPSSPEAEPASSKRSAGKPPHRKKRNPRSFAGIDMSKSMNDAGSPASTEKLGSSISRFFSRTKSNH